MAAKKIQVEVIENGDEKTVEIVNKETKQKKKPHTKLNWPNRISLIRIALIPLIIVFYFIPFNAAVAHFNYFKVVAAIIFMIAALTDGLDGYLARKNNQVTKLGAFLDTVADKVLFLVGLVLICFDSGIASSQVFNLTNSLMPVWFAVLAVFLMIGRDFMILGLKGIAVKNEGKIITDKFGKSKFLFQMLAISLYMLYAVGFSTNATFNLTFEIICLSFLCVSIALSTFSGINYLIKNRKCFVQE